MALVFLQLAGAPAQAQRPSGDTFRPAPTADGVVTLQGAHTPGHLLGSVAVFFDYSLDPLTVPSMGADPVAIEHRFTAHVVGQLGLGRRGALVVDVPAVLIQAGGWVRDAGTGVPRAATSDIAVDGRVRLVGALPDEAGDVPLAFGLAAVLGATVPTGRQSAFTGDGQITLHADLVAAYELAPGLGVQAAAGYLLRPYDRILGYAEIDDAFRFAIGAKAPLPSAPNLGFRLEVRGEVGADGPARNLYEVDGGVAVRVRDVTLSGIVGAGLGKGFGSPDLRAIIGLSWAPRARDADGDGIPDEADACPHLAGSEAQEGCPDLEDVWDDVPEPDTTS
jgi:OmpA-OmpF porin, OOP family